MLPALGLPREKWMPFPLAVDWPFRSAKSMITLWAAYLSHPAAAYRAKQQPTE